jgi:hypothetical protein
LAYLQLFLLQNEDKIRPDLLRQCEHHPQHNLKVNSQSLVDSLQKVEMEALNLNNPTKTNKKAFIEFSSNLSRAYDHIDRVSSETKYLIDWRRHSVEFEYE